VTDDSVGPHSIDGTDRRTFVMVAGALAGGAALAAMSTPAAAQGASSTDAQELKKPASLGPRAAIDNRFPASFSRTIPKSVEVLIGYFTALSQRDVNGMAEYLHFPFVTFEGTDPILVNSRAEFIAKTPASMNMSLNPERFTDHDGYIKKGSYDIIQSIEPICFDPVVCGMTLTYDRFDSTGKRLLRCDGVYTVTNIEGKWGIEFISTIFTPDMQVGLVYEDGVMWADRLRIDHDISYQLADVRNEPVPQIGATASIVNYAGQPWSLAPNGRAMEQFKIMGVKSRLRFMAASEDGKPPSVRPARDMDQYYKDYRKLFQDAGDGNFGFVYGKLPNARILHQTFNKVHQFSGAIRFTTQGELCSYNSDIGIITYKLGRWATAGNACYTTPHDRSNDLMPS
jgi:hypothetical protein